MPYNPQDHFFKKAKAEHFAARSVYKLEEIQRRRRILQRNDTVLDLGAFPGSWSQYASEVIGPKGRILGVDLKQVSTQLDNAVFIQADILSVDFANLVESAGFAKNFDVVLSDMAPNTTGVRIADQTRSFELCEIALEIATQYLKANGNFVCKFFDGPDFNDLRQRIRQHFTDVHILRPESTRKESKELFFIGLNKKSSL